MERDQVKVDVLEQLSKCTGCALGKGKGVPPDTRMIETADILVVGEAPGREEARAGIPMVGQSGTLARRLLAKAGLGTRVVIMNAVNCRPPSNRDPEQEELDACYPWFDYVMEHMKPRAVITMGRLSTKHIAGRKYGIGQNHGKVTEKDGIYWLALYHPAYLLRLRGTKQYRDLEASTLQGMDELKHYLEHGREIPHYGAQTSTPPIPTGMEQYAYDFETVGKDPRTCKPILVSMFEGVGTFPQVTNNVDIVKLWEGRPVAHHQQFDLVIALRLGLELPEKADCTMVMAWMLGERHLGLKDLSRKELGVPTMAYQEMLDTPGWATKMNYSAQDSVLAANLFPIYWKRMTAQERAIYEMIEAPLAPILALSTYRGLEVDVDRAQKMLSVEEKKVEMTKDIIHSFASDMNPNSWQQKQAWIAKEFGIKVKSTDRDQMKDLFNKTGHPIFRALIAYSVANKAAGGHLKHMAESDLISCIWHQTGTETGRLAASDENLMNPPHRIARCIKAREGMKFVSADYSQLEMRIAAVVSNDTRMIDSYRKGKDLHKELCMAVYGVQTDELRVRAKAGNFEMLFGGGYRKLSMITGMPEREAKSMHTAHRGLYPRFHEWVEEAVKKGYEDGYAETLLGRRRHLWDRDSMDEALQDKVRREAINTPIQGSGADFTKLAQVLAHPLLDKIDGWLPLQVHDSLVAEVPEDRTQDTSYILEHSMLASIPKEIRQQVPFKVDIKVDDYLG